jgi:protein ImuA
MATVGSRSLLYKQPVLRLDFLSLQFMQSAAALSIPHVWRVNDLAREEAVLPSGNALLDAALPGGGWPLGNMVELLQERPEAHVWQLLLPALGEMTRIKQGPVVLVGAPCIPFAPSLSAQGLPADRLMWIRADRPAARLWSAEQALRCEDVIALVAWLPQARTAELRRLHLSARQTGKLHFVLRSMAARMHSSPAPLRLLVRGVDEMELRILKRKGPPLEQPLRLPAQAARLQALLNSRRRTGAVPVPVPERRSHVLDRLVTQA